MIPPQAEAQVVEPNQDETPGDGKEIILKDDVHVIIDDQSHEEDETLFSHEEDETLIQDTKTCFKDALTRFSYLNGIIGHLQVKETCCKPTSHEKKEMENLSELIHGVVVLLMEQNVHE